MRNLAIAVPKTEVTEFCEKNGIVKLQFFGSVLRDDFTDSSDIDVIIDFAPDVQIGLFRYGAIERELSDILGRKVDLQTRESLSKYFRDEVLSEAETVYDAAQ